MKKIFTLIALLGFAATMMAQPRLNTLIKAHKPADKVRMVATTTDTANPDYSNIQATHAETWYYNQYLGNGSDLFDVILTTSDVRSDGMPSQPGIILHAYIVADTLTGSDIVLPTGEWTVDNTQAIGTILGSDAEMDDCFWNPENPDDHSQLYTTQYMLEGGTLNISKDDNGIYTIKADLSIASYDDNGQQVYLDDNVHLTYTGEMTYKNKDPKVYTPFPAGEYELDLPNVSGRYTVDGLSGGNYSLTFYNVPLTSDGFVAGEGYTLNMELLVPNETPANPASLSGNYSFVDPMAGSYDPYTYIGGLWYDMYGTYAAIGTAVTHYDELGLEDMIGLISSGNIGIAIPTGEETFSIVYDLYTPEGAHFTGAWNGPIFNYIEDMSVDQAVRGISSSDESEETARFSANGTRLSQPQKGLNIIRYANGKVKKVMVK